MILIRLVVIISMYKSAGIDIYSERNKNPNTDTSMWYGWTAIEPLHLIQGISDKTVASKSHCSICCFQREKKAFFL